MTAQIFEQAAACWGREVTVFTQQFPHGMTVKAFFQQMGQGGTEQFVPSPLGMEYTDKTRYIGPAELPLACDDVCRILADGEVYRPLSVRPVRVGNDICHWEGVFTHRQREVI